VLVAAGTLVVAGVSVAAPAPRQPSPVAAFEQHHLSEGHTIPADVSADQVLLLNSITGVVA
jgi:hypothetical protein